MSEKARRLIAENLESKKTSLDLNHYLLTYLDEVPELGECVHLTDLDLRGNDLTDISPLQGLTALTNLNLYWNKLTDISFLEGLTSLTNLDLSYNRLSDISSLQDLTALTNLRLRSNRLTDISFLQRLTSLINLNLSYNELSDISSWQGLTALTDLDLCGNQLTNISSLQGLTALTNLDLSVNQLTNISSLQGLTALTNLNLSDNELSDISSWQGLTALTDLDLSYNQLTDISFLQGLTSLTDLNLWGNPIQYIPKEIYQRDNCANELQNYFQEIKTNGKTTNNQLKIMFLGNGSVGKTTLLHWFIDNDFKDIPQDRRTEGIIIQSLPLDGGQIVGNFWDFGGQEIYHATHRLFLGKRTLYILVWATKTAEKETELRHPPPYWLDMIADIQTADERSTVLIVQNLRDYKIEQNYLTNDQLKAYHERGLDIKRLTVDAKEGDGIDDFKSIVTNTARNLLKKHEEHLPTSWVEIRQAVMGKREVGKKTLTLRDFADLCKDAQPLHALDYLHRAGEVFYYPNQFENNIVLDQKWALDKVYAVLKNKHIAPYKGILPLDVLLAIWQQEDKQMTLKEAKIFVNFMMGNKLMFYTEGSQNRQRKEEFVIPQLLPNDKPEIWYVWRDDITDKLIHRIDYAFLHRDIIERFIVATAHLSNKAEYWRDGLHIRDGNSKALIEVVKETDADTDYPRQWIRIQVTGQQKDSLLQKIRQEFNKIRPLDKATESVWQHNAWHSHNDKINLRPDEKSGFPAERYAIIHLEKKFLIMELLKKAIELVTGVFNNTAVKKFGDDFVTETVNWIRPIFLEEDKKLVDKLETQPTNPLTQSRLSTKLEDLLEKDDFKVKLLELIEKGKQSQQMINNNAHVVGNENLVLQNLDNSTVTINIHKGGSGSSDEKKKLSDDFEDLSTQARFKKQIADGKLKDVLESLIRLSSKDADKQNTAYLQLGRWNSINSEIDRGIVSRESAGVELNKIKNAVLKMVDDMD